MLLFPRFLQDYFTLKSDKHPYETRGASGIHIQPRTNYRKFSFHYTGPHLWNSLPSCLNTKAKYKHYSINTKLITD